jgi:ubiquinone/menaquinone biosynthesis C-methylase UbiE
MPLNGKKAIGAATPTFTPSVPGTVSAAVPDSVVPCNMVRTPLQDESLGAAVFSLSLMSHNWPDYLEEAHRVLKSFGLLFVAEPAKRWEERRLERATKEHGFTLMFSYQRDNFRYLGAVKGVL